MNKITKGILIIIIVIVGLILIKTVTTPITAPNKYAAEAVRILEKYKDFDIDAREADNRLKNIMEEVYEIKEEAADQETKNKYLDLWLELMSIQTQLHHYGKATGYQVDEAIKALEAHY